MNVRELLRKLHGGKLKLPSMQSFSKDKESPCCVSLQDRDFNIALLTRSIFVRKIARKRDIKAQSPSALKDGIMRWLATLCNGSYFGVSASAVHIDMRKDVLLAIVESCIGDVVTLSIGERTADGNNTLVIRDEDDAVCITARKKIGCNGIPWEAYWKTPSGKAMEEAIRQAYETSQRTAVEKKCKVLKYVATYTPKQSNAKEPSVEETVSSIEAMLEEEDDEEEYEV